MSRREWEPQNLEDAFVPMPEDVRVSLLRAAGSVKEEEPKMKRITMRSVLIAALILIAMTAVALAAGELLGWTDFLTQDYSITVPKAAQDALEETQTQTFEVGPLSFSVRQRICDGHIAVAATGTRATDGSQALYVPSIDIQEAIGTTIGERLGLAPETTWPEAAQALNLPLYSVRSLIEVDDPYFHGEAMEDAIWNEDGSLVYLNMPLLNSDAEFGDTLPVTFYLNAASINPDTGDVQEQWTQREAGEIPVNGLVAERTYLPAGEAAVDGFTLKSVFAEQYVTGVYLTAAFTADEAKTEDDAYLLYEIRFLDAHGTALPRGMNLSAFCDTDEFPEVILSAMISADSLPDSLLLAYGDTMIEVK